ncbi:hypothetical membrane protein, conserved [Thermococcus kodakarensis KOD1]|uniref:Hypothetical membrane protein, conserved n=1 Tax=Thermococcus kodakarensis (strain ATCC BAA-918 / JCM 12380 / KOD1) TaxID=69014 RepID=Q5JCZ7_THEKO|nr:hypothetical protein [Thermococcus kodakarensis]WCN28455.1 hypothetical protein POG15_01965 [Thermococcus kodakarensis]WCN28656.1 hypothetical protein POG15_03130 [Thermococcus kodakarensis]WCN30751.1 hypothetical protein POG21_01965 [Thermococcus kodakarensis]WCN30954.1 hypothetical protein POG21_03130 [Thermococcus kodakarensis]BAD84573.1 hypothetical membrane protein, conserved [Thermococcus kodakarensis KOD1]
MKTKSLIQLIIFFVLAGAWYYIAWPMMTKEALAVGAVGGVLMHWALTNKGNKALVIIEPFTSSWRVLLYDMMLLSFLAALWQANGAALLDALKDSVENLALLLALLGGIGVDYGVEG